jgi:hypothetical protein
MVPLCEFNEIKLPLSRVEKSRVENVILSRQSCGKFPYLLSILPGIFLYDAPLNQNYPNCMPSLYRIYAVYMHTA